MLGNDQVNELMCLVATWDRDTLARQFRSFRSTFPVDFTPEFFATQPVDRLRHIFLALCLQNGRMPTAYAPAPTARAA